MTATTALEISNLSVTYRTSRGDVSTLDGISVTVAPGEIVGVVGESGSGKSTLAASITGTLAPNAGRTAETLRIGGNDLLTATDGQRRGIRRDQLGVISQNPITSMDPTRKIRRAFADIGVAPTEAAATLRSVGLTDVERVLQSYPHQLSGGMAQRAGIALALARKPTLMIADEPTSALDADVAGAVLEQLLSLVRASGAALVLITHDLSVVEKHCQRVVVMHQGVILEDGPVDDVLSTPAAPYTKALLAATGLLHSQPRQQRPSEVETVIDVRDVTVDFQTGPPWERTTLRALDNVSLSIRRGEMLGIVGPSGSGKSTLGRLLLGLERPGSGSILVEGRPLRGRRRGEQGTVQVVLQHPDWALNPSLRVGSSIAEPLAVVQGMRGAAARTRVTDVMERLGLDGALADRFPHELSGGQRQRASIARALVARPKLIVFDEAVSSLDVSVQAQVLREIAAVQDELGFTGVFVSHDLGAVAYVADRVIRMDAGKAVELDPSRSAPEREEER